MGGTCHARLFGNGEPCEDCPAAHTFATGETRLESSQHTDRPGRWSGWSGRMWPALVPAKFEVAVLLAAIATLVGLFVRRGLYPRLDGGAPDQPSLCVADDGFCVRVLERDAGFSRPRFRAPCEELEPAEVTSDWRVA